MMCIRKHCLKGLLWLLLLEPLLVHTYTFRAKASKEKMLVEKLPVRGQGTDGTEQLWCNGEPGYMWCQCHLMLCRDINEQIKQNLVHSSVAFLMRQMRQL